MFFLYVILVIFIISIILTLFTSIEIEIKNLNYTGNKNKQERINKNYKIIIKLYLFEKIKYLNISIEENQFKKEKILNHLNKLEQKMMSAKNNVDIKILDILKNAKLQIISLDLQLDISLEDAAQNAISIGIISTIIPIVFRKYIEKREQNKMGYKAIISK